MEINENNKKNNNNNNNNISSGKVCRALDYSDQDILINDYMGKHGSDNIEGLCYDRLDLFNISAMVRPKDTWGSY